MEDPQSWQELLQKIISDSNEHARVARAVGVSNITLNRWATGISKPRIATIKSLLEAVPPEYQAQLRELLQIQFPGLGSAELAQPENIVPEIPSAFYASVVNVYTTSPPILRSSTICISILQQIIRHLDPQKLGLQAVICQCSPPHSTQKVRSLRTMVNRATPPWENYIDRYMTFLGLESQAGNTVSSGHILVTNSYDEHKQRFSTHSVPHSESIVTYPLLYFDRIAGAIGIISTQKNYFSAQHLEVIQHYADLLVLAFEPGQFYPLKDINLGIMPPGEMQVSYLDNFQERVSSQMLDGERRGEMINRGTAEIRAIHEIEDAFLNMRSHQLYDF